MSHRRLRVPLVRLLEWVGGNEVRLFFQSGKVMELPLPWVEDASEARVTDGGMGVDPGDGKDVSGLMLVERDGRVLRQGRPGWIGS